jgi:hypothetical protein
MAIAFYFNGYFADKSNVTYIATDDCQYAFQTSLLALCSNSSIIVYPRWRDLLEGFEPTDEISPFGKQRVVTYELMPNGDYQTTKADGTTEYFSNEFIDNTTATEFNWANGDGTWNA